MASRVLLLQPRDNTRWFTTDALEQAGIEVFPCKDLYDAQDVWANQETNGLIDAFVVELICGTRGLDERLRVLTKEGMYTGWVWLWHGLNPEKLSPHPISGRKLVIYSLCEPHEFHTEYMCGNALNDNELMFFERHVTFIQMQNVARQNELTRVLKGI